MALAVTYAYALQPVWEGEGPKLSYRITFVQSYHCIVASVHGLHILWYTSTGSSEIYYV